MTSPTRRGHKLVDERTYYPWWHIFLRLVTVEKRLFSLNYYLAGETISTILHCQTNIIRRGVSLDVWFPETGAQITRTLNDRQTRRYKKQTGNENSHSATILIVEHGAQQITQRISATTDVNARSGLAKNGYWEELYPDLPGPTADQVAGEVVSDAVGSWHLPKQMQSGDPLLICFSSRLRPCSGCFVGKKIAATDVSKT